MNKTIDYYHFLVSPWTYLAIERFNRLRDDYAVTVNYKPIDVASTFELMGGVPLPKRHPARQQWRLQELERWASWLGVPINLKPAYFPADQTLAACMVYAAGGADGEAAAGRLSDACLRACWAEQRDIADADTLRALADDCGLDGTALIEQAQQADMRTRYLDTTAEAHQCGVFGSPSYVLDGELFWGQDRLDFLERALGS